MQKMVIVGASDAGVSAAVRIKEIDAQADVTVISADAYPGFSVCGLPYFLSGEVEDWRSLAHHNAEELERQGIRLLLNHRAETVEPRARKIRIISSGGQVGELAYDRLLIATGAEPARPRVSGLDEPGVFFLRSMADGFAVKQFIERRGPRRSIIVGGGYIGLEMAEALVRRGIPSTLLEYAPEVLTTIDPGLARKIHDELESRGVKVLTGWSVAGIEPANDSLAVHSASGEVEVADLVLMATGVRPSTVVAQSAGVALGTAGAIRVGWDMATNVDCIWAAGDCSETWHHLLKTNVYMPLGSTAHKQGRVAGENMAGGHREFQGSLGTQVVKVFDLIAAGTGLRDTDAVKAGFDPLTVGSKIWDRNVYYPGAEEIYANLTADRRSGRLLGAQIVGGTSSQVAKRIDVIAAAIYQGMAVDELSDIDMSYAPPVSSPWDPLQQAAMRWRAAAAHG